MSHRTLSSFRLAKPSCIAAASTFMVFSISTGLGADSARKCNYYLQCQQSRSQNQCCLSLCASVTSEEHIFFLETLRFSGHFLFQCFMENTPLFIVPFFSFVGQKCWKVLKCLAVNLLSGYYNLKDIIICVKSPERCLC